jgi:hypothetical protein
MQVDLKAIASQVEKQFPAFYREEGPDFIAFVKAYYEWMDEYGPVGEGRNLPEITDIDSTQNKFLNHFLNKYMYGIPKDVLGDQILLEKHILDLYRSKGSIEGIKLLFRFLYQQEIDVYLPKIDILKLSDGKWIRRRYLEVSNAPTNESFNNKFITGTTSGAIGYVESAIKLYLGDQINYLMYMTNITPGSTGSNFIIGEHIIHDDIDLRDAPYILGSPASANVADSSTDWSIGDILITDDPQGEGLKYAVSTLVDPYKLKGYIKFNLLDGGFGYALDSPVAVSYASATTGSGAGFKIGEIANTRPFTYNINLLSSILNIRLNAANYGPSLNNKNISNILDDALSYQTMTVGTIKNLHAVTSGNHQYNGSLNVVIKDLRIYGYGIGDGKGGFWGGDAKVTALPSTGNGVIETVQLVSSGVGYNSNGQILPFYNGNNTDLTASLQIIDTGVGIEEGYWKNTDGFLSSNKFVQDSDYYQEFSYEIRIEKSFNKYVGILKKVMHPIGNKVFGQAVIVDSTKSTQMLTVMNDDVVQPPYTPPPIIKDTLVLHLNGLDLNSYPGSGVHWNDISTSMYNATLSSGSSPPVIPFFAPRRQDSIEFNTVVANKQYLIGPSTSPNLDITGDMTIDIWFKINVENTGSVDLFGKVGSALGSVGFKIGYGTSKSTHTGFEGIKNSLFFRRDYSYPIGSNEYNNIPAGTFYTKGVSANYAFAVQRYQISSPDSLKLGIWYNLQAVTSGNNNYIYLNGKRVGQPVTLGANPGVTFSAPFATNITYGINTSPYRSPATSISPLHSGDIGNIKVYARAFTSAEVKNNYNALKLTYV